MDIAGKKIELINLLIEENQESVLDEIKSILSLSVSKQQKKAIDDGYSSLETHPPILHDKVMEETKKRYPEYFKK